MRTVQGMLPIAVKGRGRSFLPGLLPVLGVLGAAFIAAILVGGCSERELPPSPQLRQVVAKWNGGQLNLGECLHFFRELHRIEEVDPKMLKEQAEQFIKEWVAEKIFWERAKETDLDRDPKYLEKMKPIHDEWLWSLLVRKNVDERIVLKRKDLKRYYEEHRDDFLSPATYSYYRIFFSNQIHTPEVAEERARECWATLEKGANFHDLVDQFSDTSTDKRYNLYGPFRAGEYPPEIEEVILETPLRRHSPPIKLPNGFMIVYPEAKSQPVVRPFDSAVGTISKDLFIQRREALLSDYLEEVSTQYRVEPRRQLFDEDNVKDDATLLTIEPGGGFYTWGQFRAFATTQKSESREEMDEAFEEFAKRKLLIHHAAQSGFENSDYFRSRFRAAEIRLLSDYSLELTIDPTVEPTPDQVKEYYEKNRESFRRPARMEAWHLMRKIKYPINASELDKVNAVRNTLNEVLQARQFIAEEGGNFLTLADRLTEYEDGGYLGFVPMLAMPPEWVSVVATLEEGEISQPIQVKDTFELVLRGEYEEPGVLKFEKARDLAREKVKEIMIGENRAVELERSLTQKNLLMETGPLEDLLARLVDRANQPPAYWLDPYR